MAFASMTAFQDAQATEWRDVAIGKIPEAIIYRDKRGTFTRSVTITFGLAVLIMLLVQRQYRCCRAFLWRGRVHADHDHGLGHAAAYSADLKRLGTPLGSACVGFAAVLSGIVCYSRSLANGRKAAGFVYIL